MSKRRVTFDFETRSKSDLTKEGAFKYSIDPSTSPTCLSFKVADEPKIYFLDFFLINTPFKKLPQKLQDLWIKFILEGYEFSGHNAGFETVIYKNILVARYGWPDIPFTSFRCTAAKAAVCALPRKLAGACDALRLAIRKDPRGHAAMMATCKPTKRWNTWNKAQIDYWNGKRISKKRRDLALSPEPPLFLEPMTLEEIENVLDTLSEFDDDYKRAAIWRTLYVYCKIDTRAEEGLDDALPDLVPEEQEIWFLNQKINWRGIKVDIPTIRKIVEIMEVESKKKLKELDTLTMGLVTKPGARKSILEFLEIEGVILPDIKAKTVEDVLKGGQLSEDMQRLLEIRKELSKTSTRKYQSFLNRANDDDKVRDILMYSGASTGRDTGTGIQVHNFPRPLIKQKEVEYVLGLLQSVEGYDPTIVEWIEALYGRGSASMVFSSLLRSMIIADEGKELYVADLSKIEVVVLWWLADNFSGLKIIKDGLDPYIAQAAANLGKTYDEVEKAVLAEEQWAVDARQLGKAQILSCGFGSGGIKFRDMAWTQYRLKLALKAAKAAVKSYRETHKAIPKLWQAYEDAAIAAVENPGRTFKTGKCKFFVKNKFLWIELPSGRRLAYREPQISWRVRTYEDIVESIGEDGEIIETKITKVTEPKKTLEFWAVNSKTKQWSLERTWGAVIAENITQAVARDIMMHGSVRLEKSMYEFLMSVHDEGLTQKDKGTGDVDHFVKILCSRPLWADENLPLEAKGWVGPRYKKG